MKSEALCKCNNTYFGNFSMKTNFSCINPLQYFKVNKQKRLQKQNSVCTDHCIKKKVFQHILHFHNYYLPVLPFKQRRNTQNAQ